MALSAAEAAAYGAGMAGTSPATARGRDSTEPGLDAHDQLVADLISALAQGLTMPLAARSCAVSVRTAHRRLAEARAALGVASTGALVAGSASTSTPVGRRGDRCADGAAAHGPPARGHRARGRGLDHSGDRPSARHRRGHGRVTSAQRPLEVGCRHTMAGGRRRLGAVRRWDVNRGSDPRPTGTRRQAIQPATSARRCVPSRVYSSTLPSGPIGTTTRLAIVWPLLSRLRLDASG